MLNLILFNSINCCKTIITKIILLKLIIKIINKFKKKKMLKLENLNLI
jgi:hypothetical protein